MAVLRQDLRPPPTYGITAGEKGAISGAISAAKAPYQLGGTFGKGVEAGLERGRIKATTSGMQNLVSAGLAGTTMAAGLGKKYEEEVASPMRLQVESQRSQALSGIDLMYAEMMQRLAEAAAQRKFAAEEGKYGRNVQFGIASMGQPGPPGFPSSQRFPTLYGAGAEGGEDTPDWAGGGSNLPQAPASTGARVSGYKPGTTFGPNLRTPSSLPQGQAPAPVGTGGFDFTPSPYYGKSGLTDPWLTGPQ